MSINAKVIFFYIVLTLLLFLSVDCIDKAKQNDRKSKEKVAEKTTQPNNESKNEEKKNEVELNENKKNEEKIENIQEAVSKDQLAEPVTEIKSEEKIENIQEAVSKDQLAEPITEIKSEEKIENIQEEIINLNKPEEAIQALPSSQTNEEEKTEQTENLKVNQNEKSKDKENAKERSNIIGITIGILILLISSLFLHLKTKKIQETTDKIRRTISN